MEGGRVCVGAFGKPTLPNNTFRFEKGNKVTGDISSVFRRSCLITQQRFNFPPDLTGTQVEV